MGPDSIQRFRGFRGFRVAGCAPDGQGGFSRDPNAVANIRVTDHEAQFARVRGLPPTKIQDEIVQVEPTQLFMFADPDGNVIEFRSIALCAVFRRVTSIRTW